MGTAATTIGSFCYLQINALGETGDAGNPAIQSSQNLIWSSPAI